MKESDVEKGKEVKEAVQLPPRSVVIIDHDDDHEEIRAKLGGALEKFDLFVVDVTKELDDIAGIYSKASFYIGERSLKPEEVATAMKKPGDLDMEGLKLTIKDKVEESISTIMEKKKLLQEGVFVQTVLFDKHIFTKERAKAWAKRRGFKYGNIKETDNYWRLRQRAPEAFDRDTFYTDDKDTSGRYLPRGVKVVKGVAG